jgi:hypothetical protein
MQLQDARLVPGLARCYKFSTAKAMAFCQELVWRRFQVQVNLAFLVATSVRLHGPSPFYERAVKKKLLLRLAAVVFFLAQLALNVPEAAQD